MNKQAGLSEVWIKASIIGSLWAASEIVLGSFLHNLKIPFSGNVLTAIAIVLLISISHFWTDKGLFWRAGLICAVLKTISPSAVIFGPMIAIISQAFLMETSVRVFGRTHIAFLIGGMLAMSWNFIQKVLNFIIFYGYNIVELYNNLVNYAQEQLRIGLEHTWLPILILLSVYCCFGLIASVIGIVAGRKIINYRESNDTVLYLKYNSKYLKNKDYSFNYSLSWLFVNVLLIIAALFILNYSSCIYWGSAVVLLAAVWTFRYKRAFKQLMRPRFWLFFVTITMLAAIVFSKIQNVDITEGLLIGVRMNFRAVVIILGFSVLGTELYNPRIREFFLKTSYKKFHLALELAFDSLPFMIANIPDIKILMKKPFFVLSGFVALAEKKLKEIREKPLKKVFIMIGSGGEGKTSQVENIINALQSNKISVGGIYSPRIVDKGNTKGYDVVNIKSKERAGFLRILNDDNCEQIGKYSIIKSGLQFGRNALELSQNESNDIVIIDEIGWLELENRGWADQLRELILLDNNHLLLTVRSSLEKQVIQKYNLQNAIVLNASESNSGEFILQHIKSN